MTKEAIYIASFTCLMNFVSVINRYIVTPSPPNSNKVMLLFTLPRYENKVNKSFTLLYKYLIVNPFNVKLLLTNNCYYIKEGDYNGKEST